MRTPEVLKGTFLSQRRGLDSRPYGLVNGLHAFDSLPIGLASRLNSWFFSAGLARRSIRVTIQALKLTGSMSCSSNSMSSRSTKWRDANGSDYVEQ